MNTAGIRTRRRAAALSVCALTLAGVLTSCSSSGGGSADNSLLVSSSSDRAQQLLAQSKKEKQLVWDTSLAGPVVDDIIKSFEAKYPFVHVSVNRADEGVIIPQAVQAIGAGKSAADVFESTASGALAFKDAAILQPYQEPNADALDSRWKTADGENLLLVTDRISYISFGYNADKVPASAVPKTLDDLLNPALKGKMAMETDTTSEELIGAIVHAKGEQGAEQFLAKLAKQNVAQTALSGSALMGLVASGQYASSPSVFHNHQQQNKAKGAPVEWVPLDPVVANVGQLGILKRAAHPATAMLFIDFMTSADGQKVLERNLYNPPEQKQPFSFWVPSEGAKSANSFNDELKSWGDLQKKYFG